jgi:Fe-S cluster assembly protein SufD
MTNGSLIKVLETAAAAPAPALLQDLRGVGRTQFEANGLPDRRQEDWRFTGLKAINETEFAAPPLVPSRIDVAPLRRANAHVLVFIDGMFSPDFSVVDDLPDGVEVTNLMLATASDSEIVKQHLGGLVSLDEHPFAALNTAVLADGALIHVPAGVRVEHPIQLLFIAGPSDRATVCAPRILMVVGKGGEVVVEEHHIGSGGTALSCPVSEIVLEEGAVVRHMIVQDESRTSQHLASRHVVMDRASSYGAQAFSFGSALARTDINVKLVGEGAEASLDGLYLTDGTQQADSHLTLQHAAPRCRSHQLYKGVLAGSSRTVFTGRIVVDQDAQKTDATQSNRNLLLSDTAIANSNPQLEIFADDVRCTHGSTVGRLDEDAVFYLQSRGIGRDEAHRILTLAFAGEILDRVPFEGLREELRQRVSDRLVVMEGTGSAA